MSNNQTDIFAIRNSSAIFSEVCTALYERELHDLANSLITDPNILKRKIESLPVLVKRAAEFLTRNNLPLELDTHNASWQYKQSLRPPIRKIARESNLQWITQYSELGTVIPIYIEELGEVHYELDSIDKINEEEQQLHLNKNGWFHFDGSFANKTLLSKHSDKFMCKPSKTLLCSACCGHTWSFNGKRQPRPLSLRELLLSGSVNWKKPYKLIS